MCSHRYLQLPVQGSQSQPTRLQPTAMDHKVPLHPVRPSETPVTLDESSIVLTIYGNAATGAHASRLKPYAKDPSIAGQDEHPALSDEAKAYWEKKKLCLLNSVKMCGDVILGCELNLGKADCCTCGLTNFD